MTLCELAFDADVFLQGGDVSQGRDFSHDDVAFIGSGKMLAPEIIMREFVEMSFVAAFISSHFPDRSSCCGCAAAVAGPSVAKCTEARLATFPPTLCQMMGTTLEKHPHGGSNSGHAGQSGRRRRGTQRGAFRPSVRNLAGRRGSQSG